MSKPSPSTANPDGTSKKKEHSGLRHTMYIVGAIVLAVVFAWFFPRAAAAMHLGGEIFLRVLMMIVVPLVMASVMSGILGLGDVRKLGRPGLYAILYYLSTTVLAVTIGLAVVNLIAPGESVSAEQLESSSDQTKEAAEFSEKQDARKAAEAAVTTAKEQKAIADKAMADAMTALDADPENAELKDAYEEAEKESQQAKLALAKANTELAKFGEEPGMTQIFENLALMLFTDNLFEAAANADLLPLIVFSLVFAGMLTTLGERVTTITKIIDQANHALMAFVMLLMKIAPLGIFCLVTARLGSAIQEGELWSVFRSLSSFILTVLLGLGFHAFVTLPLIYWIFTRKNPYKFMLKMSQAILTAFSTSSSSATLPVTMETAVDEAGVSRQSAEFVLPLGATVNMDGTALYEATAAIFIAQAVALANPNDPELALTLGKQLLVAVTATMAAIGAAGIPEAGLFTMLIVFNAVGLSPEYIALILPVDWFLDRFRTAVNCFGDSVGAAVVDQSFEAQASATTAASPPNPIPASPGGES